MRKYIAGACYIPGAYLGEKVKMLRKDRGWTLARLARDSYLTTAFIHSIEINTIPRVSVVALNLIADAFGVTVDYLIDNAGIYRPVDDVLNKAFMNKYNSLPEKYQEIVRKLVKELRKAVENETA